MWQDIRQAVRILRKHPRFTGLAACVLSVGIGLTIAIVSIVYAIAFKPLPVDSPERLVSIYQLFARQPDRPTVLNSIQYAFLKEHNRAFTDVTGHHGVAYTLRADGEVDVVNAELVLSNYFTVLSVQPQLGRTLLPAEDDPASVQRAVVISHTLWTHRFRSDPAILGKQVYLASSNRTELAATIVGVMRPGFNGISPPWRPTLLWITVAQGRERPDRGFAVAAIGRLKPDATFEQARSIVLTQGRQLHASDPLARPESETRLIAYRTNAVRVPSDPAAAVVPTRVAAGLSIVVAFVLLVAAANVAGLLLARGVARSTEIAVRMALGAPPLSVTRQLLTETMLLSAIGSGLGVIFSVWLLGAFRALTPAQFAFDVTLDLRMLLFATAVCLVTGTVVAILPARQAMTLDVLPWLASGAAAPNISTSGRLRHLVTIPQVTLSLMLLLITGLHVRDLVRIELADPGYDRRNLLVATPALRPQDNHHLVPEAGARREDADAEHRRQFYRQLLLLLGSMPGALEVAVADALPLREPAERPNWSVVAEDSFFGGARHGQAAERASVSPGYFRTMGIPLLSGRDFDERDTTDSQKTVIVSAALAHRLWPGGDILGRGLTILNEWAQNEKAEWYQVIGVVKDVAPVLRERGIRPFVYFGMGQVWQPSSSFVVVRAPADAHMLAPVVKDAINRADARADVRRVQTMAQAVGEILYPRRAAAAVLALSATLGLVLALLGVYSVVSYSVAQRTTEIGVRMALGATGRDVIRFVLGDGIVIGATGSATGVLLAYAGVRLISSQYLPLPRVDIGTFLLMTAITNAVVLLACYLPARRASQVSPLEVLRRP